MSIQIHVLTIETCNPIVYMNELYKIIQNNLSRKNIKRMTESQDTIKVFFRNPVSFVYIDKLAEKLQCLENIKVKEMSWRTEKINGITCFLDMVVS